MSGPAKFLASLVLASAVVLAALAILPRPPAGAHGESDARGLMLYCAAGVRPPVEAVLDDYAARYGVLVEVQYGGSGTLLSSLQLAARGDLYLAADHSYVERAAELGLVAETLPLARLRPVVAVPAGNPLGVRGVADLLRDDVTFALANPEAAAVGKVTRRALERAGSWQQIASAARVFKPTVTEVATDVRIGAVDAGIIWDATVNQFPQLAVVTDPLLDAESMQITAGILRSSTAPTRALHFARFLAAADAGLRRFAELGYEVVAGDPWEEHPEILLFSGAMLRPAVEGIIDAFEVREGVTVTRVYNGCGVLVSQMKSGADPEAYLSCDTSFLEQVSDRFDEPVTLSENDLVILVPRGNPQNVSTAGLGASGLRVGLAHPEKSALGALTRTALVRAGLEESVAKNLVLDSATGDFLVNQIRTGSLDAVIVYRSNARSSPGSLEHLEIVELGLPDATAVQPMAVSKSARHPRLSARLLDALRAAEFRERFEQLGFRWRGH